MYQSAANMIENNPELQLLFNNMQHAELQAKKEAFVFQQKVTRLTVTNALKQFGQLRAELEALKQSSAMSLSAAKDEICTALRRVQKMHDKDTVAAAPVGSKRRIDEVSLTGTSRDSSPSPLPPKVRMQCSCGCVTCSQSILKEQWLACSLQETVDDLRRMIEDHISKQKDLVIENGRLRSGLQVLREENDNQFEKERVERCSEFAEVTRTCNNQVRAVTSALESIRTEKEALAVERDALREKLAAAEAARDDSEKQANEHATVLDKLVNDRTARVMQQVQELRDTLETRTAEAANLSTTVKQLRTEVAEKEDLTSERDRLRHNLTGEKGKVENLTKKLQEAEKSALDCSRLKDQTEEQLAISKGFHSASRGEVAILRNSYQKTLDLKDTTIAELKETIETKETELENIQTALSGQQVRIDVLVRANKEHSHKFEKLQSELSQERSTQETSNKRLSALENDKSALSKDAKKHQSEKSKLETELKDLNKQSKNVTMELEKKIATLERELKSSFRTHRNEMADTEKKLAGLRDKVGGLEKSLSTESQNSTQAKRDKEKSKAELENIMKILEKERKDRAAEKDASESKICELEKNQMRLEDLLVEDED